MTYRLRDDFIKMGRYTLPDVLVTNLSIHANICPLKFRWQIYQYMLIYVTLSAGNDLIKICRYMSSTVYVMNLSSLLICHLKFRWLTYQYMQIYVFWSLGDKFINMDIFHLRCMWWTYQDMKIYVTYSLGGKLTRHLKFRWRTYEYMQIYAT